MVHPYPEKPNMPDKGVRVPHSLSTTSVLGLKYPEYPLPER